MKFRHHRGSLDDAMKTIVELEPSLKALREHLVASRKGEPLGNYVGTLRLEYRGEDERIGWSTYIVTEDGNAIGYTDGPITVGYPREIKDNEELMQFVNSILDLEITPINEEHAGARNGKELIRAKACAKNIKHYLDIHTKEIELEFNAVARKIAEVLPVQYDWQHIREASKAFVARLEELSLTKTVSATDEKDQTKG